ncbi:MAG: flagellar biosynthesis protein FlhA [Thermoanaerobacteraceae bacterium]|uniref:Flagellar biosynthesis protein FlhA n=1 Tax=Biomaibacter acetigenes TaxID=2316383 RepID=A0A3G2R4P1_9FIRM|nr:flagellar biosynthesis protein FlhA [Biomaibacter acetigenes]AYO30484.1 flagellar biosynthesis protein FlhA [Biomaibacter acetigenes]MDK2877492.1 flagellar biosynthesis protein FlhA [Thermoanaerobacteraceae bacterium]MDN5302258.1 flagellar biosynthesis protein FlhA [Thermoanaerobacteraceae bacterium]
MKFGDVAVALMAIMVVVMMIIPLPSSILDLLLSFNITFSLVILLISMNMEKPLDFSIFPSMLLLTTLLRLSLNISSTRLILLNGYAGKVIESFGNFVVKGNVLVGFIIFLIIIIMQFIVITRGAERVAEVAARFTLDAMPGKQMSIDADLNSGLINESEARRRRTEIQREADFYGAMDGASKFVKGDAIAGIIITVINIVGGLITGVLFQHWDIMTSINRYTLLTVGDGLVSQIPALLVSTATGIVVTKAASAGNLGEDLIKQLISYPKLLLLASGVLAFFAIIPGLPHIPFITLAGALGYIGLSVQRISEREKLKKDKHQKEKELEEMRKPENIFSLLQVDPIEVEFGYNIIPLADVNQGGDLLDRVVMIRRQCALDLGMVVPMVRLRDNIQLKPNEYVIKIKGVEAARGEIKTDHFMVMNPTGGMPEIEGIPAKEPAFGLPAKWITGENKEKAEMQGYTVVDASSVLATHLTEVIKSYAHELIGRQEVKNMLDNLKEQYPSLLEELVPKVLSLGEIQKVLSNLLKENIPIRDMVTILEALGDYAGLTKDTDMLTEYVRQRLKRVITHRFTNGQKVQVITLDGHLENQIMNAIRQNDQGTYIALEPSYIQKIRTALSKLVNELGLKGVSPVVLTSPMVRMYFRKIVEDYASYLPVISYNELEPGVEVQSVGTVMI